MPRAFACLGCRRLFPGAGSRCGQCQRAWDRERNAGRYVGERPAMAKVRRAAERDSSVVCHLCGSRTAPEVYRAPAGWVADHDQGRLLAAHGGCNSAKGGRTVAEFRARLAERMPDWF